MADKLPFVIITPRKVLCQYDSERYSLKDSHVDVGDVVFVADNGTAWLIIDTNQLSNDNGYRELGSLAASAVTSVNGDTGAVTVDANDVGLGSVNNTADTNKPVSAAQAAADAAVAAAAAASLASHTSNTSNPHSTTKSQVGLGSVTNDVQLKAADLDTDAAMAANSDTKIPSQAAVRTYVANNAASGSSVRKQITQSSHGFSAKQAVLNNNGTWALAIADDVSDARPVGVVESVTTNTFVVVFSGEMAVTGWAPNEVYYLSDATPGLLTTTQPTAETSYLVQVATTSTTAVAYVEIGEPLSLAKISNSDLASDAARPSNASQVEAEAGTETNLRSWSPLRISQAIAALAGSGGGAGFTTGMGMMWPRARAGTIPSGWIEADGNNGTTNESDIGDFLLMQKHGGTVADPTFSPVSGSYGGTQSVTLSTVTSGAVIKYTTNGTNPSRSAGSTYSTPISVSSTQTIKAMAYKDNGPFIDSSIASATFTIDPNPVISSWTIETNGTTHTIVFSENVSVGSGGSGGFTANLSGGAVTLTYASGTGSSTLVFTGSRTVVSGETETGSKGAYSQPGNGIEATTGGDDVATSTGNTIVNNSTQTAGTSTYYTSYTGAKTADEGLNKLNAFTGLISSVPAGTITKLGVYISVVNYGCALQLGLLNSSRVPIPGTAVIGGTGTTGWQDIDCSYVHAGGDLHVAAILDTSAPYDGAMAGERLDDYNGAYGSGTIADGSWPNNGTIPWPTIQPRFRVRLLLET